jgi:DNA-binding transcriptional LysR family regulator
MQPPEWSDLRYLLAVARAGSLAGAARRLLVHETTVARRIAAAEAALGAALFDRGDGRMRPTRAGAHALLHAERVEQEIVGLTGKIGGIGSGEAGTVRLTSVPIIVNRVLIPALPSLAAQHPDLQLELIAEPRDLNLTKREADLALRFARPRTGGSAVLARRIARLDYAVFGPARTRRAAALPWITYEEGLAHLPQARWIASQQPAGQPPLLVNDAEAIIAAVRAGLGRSLLPRRIGERIAGLRRLEQRGFEGLSRELWLLVHADLRRLARIAVVIDWIEETIARLTQR